MDLIIPQEYHPEKVGGYIVSAKLGNMDYIEIINLEDGVTTEFLSWAITYCLSNNYNIYWTVSENKYTLGSVEFVNAMVEKVRSEKSE